MTGPRVNRAAGYGLEIPCVYRFYGPKPYTDKVLTLKILIEPKCHCCAKRHNYRAEGAYAHTLGVLKLECPLFGGSKQL